MYSFFNNIRNIGMRHIIKKNNNLNVNLKFDPSTMSRNTVFIHAIYFTWIGSTYYTRL